MSSTWLEKLRIRDAMIFIKLLGKLLKALSSDASPGQIAGGFVLGMILGLTPFWSLHNLIVILLIILIRVNISMAIFSFLIFSGIAYLFDPLFHSLGYVILVDATFLHGFWVALYNLPLLALSNFNNTVVMGSLVVSLVLVFPMYPLTEKGVVFYREQIDAKVKKWKITKLMKSSKIYSIYTKIRKFGD